MSEPTQTIAAPRQAIKSEFAAIRAMEPATLKWAAVVLLGLALSAGIGLRMMRLGSVPPGLHQDEACSGYDAYSLWTTGRDHHGNFLPILIQAFNDYRPPLFTYSLVPLVGVFGLKPATVRLGAALWGSADLVAITSLAGLTMGLPAAVATAILVAFSPWHLPLSRYGVQKITASPMVSFAMLCFMIWLRRLSARWLLAAAFCFGLSFYAYNITKVFCPLLIGWLALLYRRELIGAGRQALAALAIVVLMTIPEALAISFHPEARLPFQRESILYHMAQYNPGDAIAARLAKVAVAGMSCFTPSYLFERGELSILNLPRHGELLPEQAPLILMGALALIERRRRRFGLVLVGWLMLAAVPVALSVPPFLSGPLARSDAITEAAAAGPEQSTGPQNPGTAAPPRNSAEEGKPATHALTAQLLFAHPSAERDLLALAPWTLLCALGAAAMLELTALPIALKTAAAGLLLAGSVFHGTLFVRSYFTDFPTLAAPYFKYGIDQVIQRINGMGDLWQPVIISRRIQEGYIDVLFYGPVPPALFQHEPVDQQPGPMAPVLHFDRYYFQRMRHAYAAFPHGIFVYTGAEQLPSPPEFSVLYPDGAIAYNVVVK